jgi:hypothetical protein
MCEVMQKDCLSLFLVSHAFRDIGAPEGLLRSREECAAHRESRQHPDWSYGYFRSQMARRRLRLAGRGTITRTWKLVSTEPGLTDNRIGDRPEWAYFRT